MKRRRNDETTENTEADLGWEYWSTVSKGHGAEGKMNIEHPTSNIEC